MNWNIAQAKQHFSDVVKQAATEPQIIYNRNTPVAAMIAAEDLAEYRAWKESHPAKPSLVDVFARMRELANGDPDPLPEPRRLEGGRPNAFVEMLAEEYPEADL
jgi:prevent-host-death family protein